jgi:hypothetical protein
VTVTNYLPTRLAAGAVMLGVGCALATWAPLAGGHEAGWSLPVVFVALAPWAAWAGVRTGRAAPSTFDREWRAFRDRWGLVWGQRLREQFNHSSKHAALGVELGWRGLRSGGVALGEDQRRAAEETLRALTKRFGPIDRGPG